ncbi:uncharacterized protein LOC143749485 [Siphateles boraxobius]|uniref:uncharacterized protein LOC143749485 n=1 Tax=Siphateles boraxobius TaxID=180520 RepID=UPI00406336E0
MDDTTDKIVHFELVQVTEASSSTAMEPIGFKRALNQILEKGIKVDVLTTDRSPSIRKIMREDYPFIHHEFDIWHVVKDTRTTEISSPGSSASATICGIAALVVEVTLKT